MKLIRPVDCHDEYHAKLLNEQGLKINDYSITTNGNVVTLEIGLSTQIRISRRTMELFSEWFLSPQEITDENENKIFTLNSANNKTY